MSINDKFYQKLKVTENGATVWKQFTYREIAETKLYNKYVETNEVPQAWWEERRV